MVGIREQLSSGGSTGSVLAKSLRIVASAAALIFEGLSIYLSETHCVVNSGRWGVQLSSSLVLAQQPTTLNNSTVTFFMTSPLTSDRL